MSELDQASYLNLATFRKTGAEVHTPVWFAAEGDRYYMFSNNSAGKVKRLRNTTRARVAPCDVRGKVLGEWRDAVAEIVADAGEKQRAHAALRRKYGWQMALLDFFAALGGRTRQREFIVARLA